MKMDHIVILLSDLENNLSFYETLLPLIGFRKTVGNVFANADGNHLDFKQAENAGHGYQRFAPGLNHLGFTAKNRDEIIFVRQTMEEAGFEVPEIQEFPDGSAIFFKDNDGMRVEVACYH